MPRDGQVDVGFSWGEDRTGFPLVRLEDRACWIHVFPVTKFQFEQFLADVAGRPGYRRFDDAWYEELLSRNGRAPLVREQAPVAAALNDPYERLFITGIWPCEAMQFARWLGERHGEEYDLPTDEEWQAALRQFRDVPCEEGMAPLLSSSPASILYERLCRELDGGSLADVGLMERGLLNWIWRDDAAQGGNRKGLNYRARGRTRPAFGSWAADLLHGDPYRLNWNSREPACGFRLVKVGRPSPAFEAVRNRAPARPGQAVGNGSRTG